MLKQLMVKIITKFVNLDPLFVFLWKLNAEFSLKEKRLLGLRSKLRSFVPDITNQYTREHPARVKSIFEYLVRTCHVFQIDSLIRAIELVLKEQKECFIADIGDSAGTHLTYIKNYFNDNEKFKLMSINLDPNAVQKIQEKGIDAICSAAEDVDYNVYPVDVYCSFQMLEHLENPIGFLKSLAENSKCKYFVVSVPLVKTSFVRLKYIRNNLPSATSENTHIFELAPEDWKLLFKHSGWDVVSDEKRTIYPESLWFFWLRKLLISNVDAIGNYVVILEKNSEWSNRFRSC